jgi:hypothetical protein
LAFSEKKLAPFGTTEIAIDNRAGLEDSTKFTAVLSDRTNRFGVLPAEIQMVLAQCTASRKRY